MTPVFSNPERKAAERLRGYYWEEGTEEEALEMAAIIAEELAPTRAMMERMANALGVARQFAGKAELELHDSILSDYAAMKKGWEAADAG